MKTVSRLLICVGAFSSVAQARMAASAVPEHSLQLMESRIMPEVWPMSIDADHVIENIVKVRDFTPGNLEFIQLGVDPFQEPIEKPNRFIKFMQGHRLVWTVDAQSYNVWLAHSDPTRMVFLTSGTDSSDKPYHEDLLVLDPTSGKELWKLQRRGQSEDMITDFRDSAFVAGNFVVSYNHKPGRLEFRDLQNGRLMNSVELRPVENEQTGYIKDHVVAADATVVVERDWYSAGQAFIEAVRQGRSTWYYEFSSGVEPVAMDEVQPGVLLVALSEGEDSMLFDLATGRVLGSLPNAELIMHDDMLFYTANKNFVRAYDRKTGQLAWEHSHKSRPSLISMKNLLLVLKEGALFTALDKRDGSISAQFEVPAQFERVRDLEAINDEYFGAIGNAKVGPSTAYQLVFKVK